MERDDRRPPPPVTEDLLRDPTAFSFFQAIRLLRLHLGDCTDEFGMETFCREHLRVRPQLSLGFPATDITRIDRKLTEDGQQYQIEATFLGLYGASSPMPTFYTEELLAEASEDKSVTRDFLDIINNDFYIQFFRAWSRSRLQFQVVVEGDLSWIDRLYCLLGYGSEYLLHTIPQECSGIRHIGLLAQYPRSALGLKTLLQDGLNLKNIKVRQCVVRKVKIPEDQRLLLGKQGGTVGWRCWIGEETYDRMGKCSIEISHLKAKAYHDLLPGWEQCGCLDNMVRGYLVEPLEYDLVLEMKPGEAQTARLGSSIWSGLGYNTWIFSGESMEHARATFPNEGGQVNTRSCSLGRARGVA